MGAQNGSFCPLLGAKFRIPFLNFNFGPSTSFFFTLALLWKCKMCVFSMGFPLFSLPRILSLFCSYGRFWRLKLHVLGPPSAPKSTPKSLRNRIPILSRFRSQICLVLGPLWAPQNRPKIAAWPLGSHLAVLELHLRGFSSCLGARRGFLMTILGSPGPIWTPPGDDFCSILAPPGPVLTPPRPNLVSRRG